MDCRLLFGFPIYMICSFFDGFVVASFYSMFRIAAN